MQRFSITGQAVVGPNLIPGTLCARQKYPLGSGQIRSPGQANFVSFLDNTTDQFITRENSFTKGTSTCTSNDICVDRAGPCGQWRGGDAGVRNSNWVRLFKFLSLFSTLISLFHKRHTNTLASVALSSLCVSDAAPVSLLIASHHSLQHRTLISTNPSQVKLLTTRLFWFRFPFPNRHSTTPPFPQFGSNNI